jgi:hypothetical protein
MVFVFSIVFYVSIVVMYWYLYSTHCILLLCSMCLSQIPTCRNCGYVFVFF